MSARDALELKELARRHHTARERLAGLEFEEKVLRVLYSRKAKAENEPTTSIAAKLGVSPGAIQKALTAGHEIKFGDLEGLEVQ